MAEFRMPSLGSDMQAGILLEWRVKPGDRVKRRDIIAVVETEKAAIEIEVYEDGIVDQLLVKPGEKVAVGTVMALLRPVDEAAVTAPSVDKRLRVSPYARKLALERQIDLKNLQGKGTSGTIHATDVLAAGAQAPAASSIQPEPQAVQESRHVVPGMQPSSALTTRKPDVAAAKAAMRRAIATAMAKSNKEIPHYYVQTRIDMSRTLLWLEEINGKRSIKERILPVVPMIRAVALALGDVPELNGYWIDDEHRVVEAMHIGFAIALRQGGLMVPALLNADTQGPDELMASLRDLIVRTRAGGLRSSEMTDATITITSLGDLGVESVFGIIYPPQVALIGFGKILPQPFAVDGMLGVRPIVSVTLAADHRATDGHRGAQFLDALNTYLQEPARL